MSYDHGLVERVRDALTRSGARGFRERSLFGGWGFLEGKSVFAVAWDRGFVVKMAPDEYKAALQMPGVTPFSPMGENAMTTWVVVNDEATADDDDLVTWVERALRGVRAVPSKRSAAKRSVAKPSAGTMSAAKRSAAKPSAGTMSAAKRSVAKPSAGTMSAAKRSAAKPSAGTMGAPKRSVAKAGATMRSAVKRARKQVAAKPKARKTPASKPRSGNDRARRR